jgi:hypothetical protein
MPLLDRGFGALEMLDPYAAVGRGWALLSLCESRHIQNLQVIQGAIAVPATKDEQIITN